MSGDFYRLCRMLHGYLSAAAFIALIFFSVTGLFLNHPGWLSHEPAERSVSLTLAKDEMTQALAAPVPGKALGEAVARHTALIGRFKSGDVQDGQAFIQYLGARGASTVTVDTATGKAEVVGKPSSLLTVVNDLHRGKNTGAAWSWIIDVTAILVIIMSVLGYVLFFSLRFRLKTSLILTAVSLLILAGVFILLTP